MSGLRPLLAALFALTTAAHAASLVQSAPVPAEMRSTAFTLTVNGQPVDVAHAAASLVIDGVEVARTGPPFNQVCGSPGNAMRYDRGSLGLRAGKHTLHIEGLHSASQGSPRLVWEGPGLPLTEVPADAYSHVRQDALSAGNRE